MRPASAPCRSSPTSSRRTKSASAAVARPSSVRRIVSRPAAEPLPVVTRIWSRARSTSAIASVGTVAGVTSSRNTVAQPTPIRPWRAWPVRNPTAASISSGASRPSSSASAATLVERARVDADRRPTSRRGRRTTRRQCARPLTRRHPRWDRTAPGSARRWKVGFSRDTMPRIASAASSDFSACMTSSISRSRWAPRSGDCSADAGAASSAGRRSARRPRACVPYSRKPRLEVVVRSTTSPTIPSASASARGHHALLEEEAHGPLVPDRPRERPREPAVG